MLSPRLRNHFVVRYFKWRHCDTRRIRRYIISVSSVMVLCLLTVFVGQYNFSYQTANLPSTQFYNIEKNVKTWYDSDLPVEILNISAEILNLLEYQRKLIRKELAGGGIVHRDAFGDLDEKEYYSKFILEDGGTPVRSIISSTWRSGSTFMGDLLSAVPATYYHYEPLLDYEIIQIRGPPLAEETLQILKNLLHCNYAPLNRYLEYGIAHSWLFKHNVRLWNLCSRKEICWIPEFLTPVCKLFPFQAMKVIRLRLSLLEDLLMDDSLNVKVVYLVRDPRGTVQSRNHLPWCPGNPDCSSPERLCSDLISDFSAAKRLRKKFPTRFRVVRYEDLSSDPNAVSKDLFYFLGFQFHPEIETFLNTHTKSNQSHIFNTIRDSRVTPYNWRMKLTFADVSSIQDICKQAMKLWGYKMAINEADQLTFNPVLPKFEFSAV